MAIKFEFGKHKGKSVRQIASEKDYGYLKWCLNQEFIKEKYPKLHQALTRKRGEIQRETYDEEWWDLQWFDMF